MQLQFSMESTQLIYFKTFVDKMLTNMEVVIDFEYLKGRQNEMFVRDLSLAAEN